MSAKANEDPRTKRDLFEEIGDLRARLDEAEQTLDAIRNGDVDALLVSGPDGDQIFSLTGAERTYRLIVETMNEAALTVGLDKTILFCNQRFCDLVKSPMADTIGQKLTAFVAPAQQQPLRTLLCDAQTGPVQRRLTLRAADGSAVSVQFAASLLADNGHTSICLVASDLTELEEQASSIRILREQQQALEESRAELQAANASLNDSRRAALSVAEDAIAAQRQAEETSAELRREVAERKRAEEDVKRHNATLEGINGVLAAGLTCRTEKELGLACLEIAQKLTQSKFGFIGEINEQGLEDIAIINPDWDACNILDANGHRVPIGNFKIHGIYGRVIAEGKSLFTNDPASHPDRIGLPAGHPPVEAFLGVPLIREGRTAGMIAVANRTGGYTQVLQEVLEALAPAIVEAFLRKRAEKALETLNKELENRVAERTAELREKDQILLLQSRQAAMGEMIGNIAHQWRQPLNSLGLTVQQFSMIYDLGELNREFVEKSVSNSMELIKHMSKTIDDFRNYFRPDKEKVEFKVNESIANTVSLIKDSFKNKHISIEVVAKDDPAINGYRNEFSQALLNILNNARDALTEREIGDPMVTITICNEDGYAVVTISDNAGGIPEEIMGKIFDPYFSTKGPQHGTGIGLFMSKSIIEKNMGGSLTARNIANGAEFRIEV